MAVNSSSSLYVHYTSDSTTGFYIIAAFLVAKIIFILPLSLLVLYLGYKKWRQQCSFATTSHSDIFTYHSAAVQLIFALGAAFFFCGQHSDLSELMVLGYYLSSVVLPAEASFHILIFVDRYLAVVHPVIYLGLRQSGGVRIRNFSIGCVWLLCVGWLGLIALYYPDPPHIPYLCFLFLSLVVVSFCSFSVLCVLTHPGPRGMVGNRKRIDQSKQRAFNNITAILAVLWLFFLGFVVTLVVDKSHVLSSIDGRLVLLSANFISLPSSLVLPLLFLHRAGKLVCCQISKW